MVVLGLVLLTISVSSLAAWVFLRSPSHPSKDFQKKQIKQFSIGVVTPTDNNNAHFLLTGIEDRLSGSSAANYSIKHYHGSNNRIELYAVSEEALKAHDLVVTFGVTSTQLATKAARLNHYKKPIIFSGIRSHQAPSPRNESFPLFGVVSKRNHNIQINKLKTLKPDLKQLLVLAPDVSHSAYEDLYEFEQFCKKSGIQVIIKRIANHNSILHQLDHELDVDAILLIARTLPAAEIQSLITHCNTNGVTLCVEELDAVQLGAAIGFGGEERSIGHYVARSIREVLEIGRINMGRICLEYIEEYETHINRKTMQAQKLGISEDQLDILNTSEVDKGHITNYEAQVVH